MYHRFYFTPQPRKFSVQAQAHWDQKTQLPTGLQAECPVCRMINIAYWLGKGPSFSRVENCQHYIDIVSGGGTSAFMVFQEV